MMRRVLACLGLAGLLVAPAWAGEFDLHQPVFAEHGMVASQDPHATQIGVDILKAGGNAIDAAVAVGFALAVTHPQAGNLGGGGFMVIRLADGTTTTIDYREAAPAAATRDMFLDANGDVDSDKAWFSHAAAGVPGSVAGLHMAAERYGSKPWQELVGPAFALAETGFEVSPALARDLERVRERMSAWPSSAAAYYKADGSAYQSGETLRLPDLAVTLDSIARDGPAGFYQGETARRIAADMKANGGLITEDDLAAYLAKERPPVTGSYRGYDIVSMGPPSSGGTHIVQILNILENFDIAGGGRNSAATIHLMAEAMRSAYADRSTYLGDPDHVDVPVAGLTSEGYAASLAEQIKPDRARSSSDVAEGDPAPYESPQTTHYSVVDAQGNAVSVTTTLNFGFGSGIVAAGTGVLLNNEMDDFVSKPGVPNAYGLVGGEANAIVPGKRPLSSMSPTIVVKDDQPWLVTGSPGGSRIITTTLQIILNTIDHGLNVAEATHATRIHHQWLPDTLMVEQGLSPDTLALLRGMGHEIELVRPMGSTQSIQRVEGGWAGASDPRTGDGLAAGY